MNPLLPLLLLVPGLAWAQTPPSKGDPQPRLGVAAPADAGPANQPPRTASPQAVNRGTDGSAAGLTQPGATGATPQGMVGSATAGAREPNAPLGVPPPMSQPEGNRR
jgi:hypothetical protein